MREIRFRVWDNKHKIMFEVMDINFVNKLVECYKDYGKEGCTHAKFKFKNIELMQFTGLKDKNGKEIYEGDIVKYFDDSHTSQIGKIVWAEVCCSFRAEAFNGDDEGNQDVECHADYDFEVIGNVWENPEHHEVKNEIC